MAGIVVYASLNHAALDRGIVEANAKVGKFARDIQRQGAGIEAEMGNQLKRAAERLAAYGTIFAGIGLAQQIIKVRGEFQQLGIAFETMLGSKEKSDRMMEQSFKFAQKTPFDMMQVTSNAKQLMAMGVSFEKVMGTMKSLGDVAAGVSVPLSRVVINYGQVLALGRLQYREVRDFAMAGIPLTEELAKNLGKTNKEILALISAGKIGFPEVEKAFQTMSGEGGKFYNLMEKQNASLTGQISNLVDKWQMALNDLGKSQEGVIYSGIKGAALLVENLKPILSIIGDLVIAYGLYKTAMYMTGSIQTAVSTMKYAQEAKELEKLIKVQMAARASKDGLIVGTKAYSIAVVEETIAEATRLKTIEATTLKAAEASAARAALASQRAIDTALMIEMDTAEIATLNTKLKLQQEELAVAELKSTQDKFRLQRGGVLLAQQNIITKQTAVNTTVDEIATIEKLKQNKVNTLYNLRQAETIAVNKAKTASTISATAAEESATFATSVNTAAKTANFTVTGMLTWATNTLTTAMARLSAIMYANPYTVAAIAIGAIVFGLVKWANAATHAEVAQKSLNKTLKDVGERSSAAKTEMDTLVGTLTNGTSSILEQVRAWDKLITKYQFLSKYSMDDILKMSANDRNKLFSDILEGQSQDDLWVQYQAQIDRIKKLTTFGSEVEGKNPFSAPIDAKIGGDQKWLDAEYKILIGIQNKIKENSRLKQEADIQGLSQSRKIVFYEGEKLRLTNKYNQTLRDISTKPSKKLLQSLEETDKQLKANDKRLLSLKEKEVTNDKAIWDAKLKNALETQDRIDDVQLKKLKSASPDQLKAWAKTGVGNISAITVNSFVDSEKDIKEATARLKTYEREKEMSLTEQNRLEDRQAKLKEGRNQDELYAAVILQGKLLKVSEDTTKQKLAIAANEYQKTLAIIEKQKQKRLEEIKDVPGEKWTVDDETRYNNSINAAKEVKLAAEVEINRQAAEEIDRIWQEVEDYRLTGYEKEKAALNKKFFEEEQQLKKLYTDQQQLQIALAVLFGTYKQKEQDIDIKYRDNALQLDLELEYSKNQISEKGLNRESKINAKNLASYIKVNKERIKNLEKNLSEENKLKKAQLELDIKNAEDAEKKRQSDLKKFSKNIDKVGKILGDVLGNSTDEWVKKTGALITSVTSSIGSLQGREKNDKFGKASDIVGIAMSVGNYLKEIRLSTENKELNAKIKITNDVEKRVSLEMELNRILAERKAMNEYDIFGIENYSKVLTDSVSEVFKQTELFGSTMNTLFKNAIFAQEGTAKRTLLGTKTGEYQFSIADVISGKMQNQTDSTRVIGNFLDPLHIFGGGQADQKARIDAFTKLGDGVTEVLKTMGKTVSDFATMSSEDMLTFFKLMEKGGYITDEATKRLVADAEAQLKLAQEAVKKMQEVFASIVGDLGSSLSDSLVEAFANNDLYSAIDAFHTKVGDVIADLVAQMVFAATMQPFFTKAQNAFMASYGLNPDGSPMNEDQLNAVDAQGKRIVDNSIIDDLENLGNDIEGGMSDYEKAIIDADKMLKNKGFNGIGSKSKDKSAGLSGQIQRTITEDTASELAGLWRRQFDDTRIIRDYTKVGITNLILIEKNTADTVKRLDSAITELQAINKNTKGVPTAAL